MKNSATNTTTLSNPPYNWVGEPKQRGTFGIISLCFSTLMICIWNTVHFNIPIRRYTVTRRFFLQVSWMFLALLAPEVLLYLAIIEKLTAQTLLEKTLKFHPHLAKPGVFTSMYNWIRGRAKSKGKRYGPIEQTPQPHFGLVHAFYAVMGGFALYESFDDDTPKSLFEISTDPHCGIEVLEFNDLIYIMEHFPHIITNITEDYILDQAASSSLSKALLMVQVGWFCMNCSSRDRQGLPLSLLEVSTLAHSFCTLVTYYMWWSKPINVATPTLLREKEAREVFALFKCSDIEYDKALEIAQKRAAGDSSGRHGSEKIVLAAGALQHLLPTPKKPPYVTNFDTRERTLVPGAFETKAPNAQFNAFTGIAIAPFFYGIAHFLAWNDQFPAPLERLIWRLSSFVVTGSGLVGVFAALSWMRLRDRYPPVLSAYVSRVVSTCVLMIPAIAHTLASGFWPHLS